MNIYGKEIPLELLLRYASVRHTSGIERSRLHDEIVKLVTKDIDEYTDIRTWRNDWSKKFDDWVEGFLVRMAKRFPHVWEKADIKEIHGIQVQAKSWRCKICGFAVVRSTPPMSLPCWKAVYWFYKPACDQI
ncbi:hypothetical protein ES702_02203 [subsurface metagenome]